jgi:hypothetical protein
VEAALLAALGAAAAAALLAGEAGPLPGLRLVYATVSALFLGAVVAYWGYLYVRRPARVDLWAVLLLFSSLFFAANGILAPGAIATSIPRAELALRALLLLAVGLAASRIAYLLISPGEWAAVAKSLAAARVQSTRVPLVLAVAGAVWLLRLYGAAQGLVLSHAGDVMAEVGGLASAAIQLSLLGRPIVLFLGAVLAMDRRPRRRLLGLAIVLAELLFAVLWARRLLLEVVVALLLVGLWNGRRVRLRQLALYGAMGAFAVLVMWPFMFHLRGVAERAGLYGTDFAGRADVLVGQVLPEAVATFDLGRSFSDGSEYIDNVRNRSRTLDLLLDVMTAHRDGVPVMGGQAFLAAMVASIPRAVWPGKERLMVSETWQVEDLIERHYGLPPMDMTSTVLTQGFADGGPIGVALYMALLGALLGLCERTLVRARCAVVGLSVYALGATLAVQIEANVTDLLVLARPIALLLVADWLAGRWLERTVSVPALRPRLRRPGWAT